VPQVVSLIPPATEMVCALGAQKELVGRSQVCDYSSSMITLPVCPSTKFDSQGSSRDIDGPAMDLLHDVLFVYRVDVNAFDP